MLTTVIAIVLSSNALPQSIQVPSVVTWKSLASQTPAIFVETDSMLMVAGKGSFVGPFMTWLDDSLTFTNTTYPQLANLQTGIVDFVESPDGGYFFAIDFVDAPSNQHRIGINRLSKFGVVKAQGLSPTVGNYESTTAMALLPEGGAVVVGSGKSENSSIPAAKAVRFDSEGQVIWEKRYADVSSTLHDIVCTPQSVLFATGFISEDDGVINPGDRVHAGIWMKLSPNGDTIATRKFGIREAVGHEIFLANDESLFIVGEDRPNNSLQRLFLRKMDQDGNLIWEKNQPYRLADSSLLVDYRYNHSALTPDGGVIFVMNVSFQDPSTLPETHTYLSKVDPNGEPQWDALLPSPIGRWNEAKYVLPLSQGGYLLSGTEQIEGEFLLQTFYALLENDGTVSIENEAISHQDLHISPNPSRDQVYLRWQQQQPGEVRLKVLDMHGRVVMDQMNFMAAGEAELAISLDHLPDGVYVIELADRDFRSTLRVIKQAE